MENKYTPIKDRDTKVPLFLGDLVENEKGLCGTLAWDDFFNRYLIKNETGENIYAQFYRKVEKLKTNKFDSTGTECRRDPNRKKW